MDLSQYKDLFISEAQEHLQTLNQAILALEQRPASDEPVERSFRAAHTIKGMAATMGYEEMSHLAHATEDLLDQVRKHAVPITPELIDLLFQALDALETQLVAIAEDRSPTVDSDEILTALRAAQPEPAKEATTIPIDVEQPPVVSTHQVAVTIAADSLLKGARALLVLKRLRELGTVVECQPPETALAADDFPGSFTVSLATEASPAQVQQVIQGIAEIEAVTITPFEPLTPAKPTIPAPSPAPPSPRVDLSQSVRVNVVHLDRLLNLVGEMVVNKSRLWRIQQRHDLPDLKEALEEHDRILSDLQDGVLASRTVPVAQVFNRFPRMVRDLARKAGKEVSLVIEGAEIELDRTILQELSDPLLHLLRNAVDHGLETPAERTAAGKPTRGQIQLTAARHQGLAVITIEDDGRGMNPDTLRRVAVKRGLLTAEQAADLTDDEAFMLICHPRFSTAQRVTDISGRGVGMDVVRRQVESLRGHLEIDSAVGQGTRFTLRLPLTLAIIQALLVRVADETYAVPLSHVHRTVEVQPDEVRAIKDQPVAVLPLELLSLRSLAELVELPAPDLLAPHDQDEPFYALVVERGGQHVGLVVDELLGREEIVIKSLSGFLDRIPGLAGATVLGEGEVVLILDAANLLSS